MSENQYCIYIMSNIYNTTLYVGITNNLVRRVYEHKNKLVEGFTSRYNLNKLVYFETTENVESAIIREKQIKNYSRAKKENLIDTMNPTRIDLYDSIL